MGTDLLGISRFFGAAPPAFRMMGSRVYLRAPERKDFEEWAALRSESRAFLAPFEPAWPADAVTRGGYRRRLQHYAADWRDDQGYSLLLFRRVDRVLLGGLSLSNLRRGISESASLGYWIGERFARQGYMTEGIKLILAFAFERLKLHRVEAACLPHNAASRQLLRKSGFREEGYARQYLAIEGRWQDHVLFGLVSEEWAARADAKSRAEPVP
jgi:[ribosomal protein S5]-alanine N-acetyltransferase